MRTIVTIYPDADREQFKASLPYPFVEFDNIPRVFVVECAVEAVLGHPLVETAERERIIQGDRQLIEVDREMGGGSWSIARSIRRKPPWATSAAALPLKTFYECVRDGEGVDLYWLDSGIRQEHIENAGRVTLLHEVVSSGGAGDDSGHGTATSSCAMGSTVGFARSSHVFSIKILDSDNAGYDGWLLEGINAVLAHYTAVSSSGNPAVVNLSLGGFGSGVSSAITNLIEAGIVVVASAGNKRDDLGVVDYFPAESDPDVIVVGGSNYVDIPYYQGPSGSSWGERVDVIAPSQSCLLASHSGADAYKKGNGTSYGCAYVSGVVACLLQGHRRLSSRTEVAAVRSHVRSTATAGEFQSAFGITLPDRILYLDPKIQAPEPIAGL